MQIPRERSYFSSSESEENDDADFNFNLGKDEIFANYGLCPVGLQSHSSTLTNRNMEVTQKKVEASFDASIISVIDDKMMFHTDKLMHAVEGLFARLSQIESRTCHQENSMDGLKQSVEHNHRRTDGRLRQLENTLKEIQCSIQDMRDKHEIAEAQRQIAKLQASKDNPQTKNHTHILPTDMVKNTSSSAQQFNQLPVIPAIYPQKFPGSPVNASSNLHCQKLPPGMTPVKTYQPFSMFLSQQFESSTPQKPYQLAQSPPHTAESTQLHLPPSAFGHHVYSSPDLHFEGSFYAPSRNYYLSSSHPPDSAAPTLQFYTCPLQQINNNQALNRHIPGCATQSGCTYIGNFHEYNNLPFSYATPIVEPSLFSSHSLVQVGGSNHPQHPAQGSLPHALPIASSLNDESDSNGREKKLSLDDVIDEVLAMGFRRDAVKVTVRKLMDDGRSVDLNVVLDKLMNEGEVSLGHNSGH